MGNFIGGRKGGRATRGGAAEWAAEAEGRGIGNLKARWWGLYIPPMMFEGCKEKGSMSSELK